MHGKEPVAPFQSPRVFQLSQQLKDSLFAFRCVKRNSWGLVDCEEVVLGGEDRHAFRALGNAHNRQAPGMQAGVNTSCPEMAHVYVQIHMCDNFVAVGPHTGSGSVILAKNSDREPNEAQALVRIPRRRPTERELQTTFIRIPQVKETNEVVLSKPFHMWGAEMGANEHGLAIGNEAVFTVVRIPRKNSGLTGMDMLRIALERCRTADEALGVITNLIETYGQDACGGYQDKGFFYFNSFAIADPKRAFILETIDRHWAALEVKSFRSISNGLTLEGEFDRASKGLMDFAAKFGKHKVGRPFSLRRDFSDFLFTRFSGSRARQTATTQLGAACIGSLDPRSAMRILRSHGLGVDEDSFDTADANNASVCMHAAGPITRSQTTGSLVADLRPDGQSTFWFTGTSAPCLSVFKPVFLPGENLMGPQFPEPSAQPDRSLWWRHERFHRFVVGNYRERAGLFKERMRALEESFLARDQELRAGNPSASDREDFSQGAFAKADQLLVEFDREIQAGKWSGRGVSAPIYSFFLGRSNRAAGIVSGRRGGV